jgi:hypothetical protein
LQLLQRITALSASSPPRFTVAPQGLHFHCGRLGSGAAAADAAGADFNLRIGRLVSLASMTGRAAAAGGLTIGRATTRALRTTFGSKAMLGLLARRKGSFLRSKAFKLHQMAADMNDRAAQNPGSRGRIWKSGRKLDPAVTSDGAKSDLA